MHREKMKGKEREKTQREEGPLQAKEAWLEQILPWQPSKETNPADTEILNI